MVFLNLTTHFIRAWVTRPLFFRIYSPNIFDKKVMHDVACTAQFLKANLKAFPQCVMNFKHHRAQNLLKIQTFRLNSMM